MHLPPELLLETVDRCDPVTLICCAATCRLLRRHILRPEFLRRLRDAARGRFAPSSLLGLFYRHYTRETKPRPPPFSPTPNSRGVVRSPFVPDVFRDYKPVESRGRLLVLRSSDYTVEHADLCVYDPVTDHRAFLPAPEVYGQSYALLTGGDDRSWSGLGVVDLTGLLFDDIPIRAQSFSPVDGTWGPVIEAPNPSLRCHVVRPSPVIIDGAAHWLCTNSVTILRFHLDTGELGRIGLPCQHSYREEERLLASSAERNLSLLVAETDRAVISVWVLTTGDQGWTRRALVDVERIRPPLPSRWRRKVQFDWFGERSSAVLLQVAGAGLLLVNLQTKEMFRVGEKSREIVAFRYCPYELDLIARLEAMQSSGVALADE